MFSYSSSSLNARKVTFFIRYSLMLPVERTAQLTRIIIKNLARSLKFHENYVTEIAAALYLYKITENMNIEDSVRKTAVALQKYSCS